MSDLSDKIKSSFFPSSGVVDTAIGMDHMDADLVNGEKAWRELLKNVASWIKQVLEAASNKIAATYLPSR